MKTKVSHQFSSRFKTGIFAISAAVLVGASVLPGLNSRVGADSFDDQINALNQANANSRSLLESLKDQAASYQDAISQLQAQINGIQASIDENEALQADLQAQIDEAQRQIDEKRAQLASDVKAMYVDGTPSTLEVLANSKDLSDFVDKQEYRTSVQNKLQEMLKQIAELQHQLQTKKAEVESLLAQENAQKDQLATARAEQNKLLAYNQSQQSAYNSEISANSKKIAQLRAQQAIANRALSGGSGPIAGDPGHGGYPAKWDNAPQDSMVDSWGMYNRECVSYTAWKVYQTYGYMPYWGGVGNANEWPGNARRAGIPTSSTPKAGSVAIAYVGYYGHAMWVEAVNDDGSIWISQYNYDYNGHYSEMLISAAKARTFTYIYFGG